MIKQNIQPGIYIILDPSMDEELLFKQLHHIVKENIAAIQIWDHFKNRQNIREIVERIFKITSEYNIPLFINNRWEILSEIPLAGVHFDQIPENLSYIKKMLSSDIILGTTCNNPISTIEFAQKNQFDYISFCSIFHSKTSNSCELVHFETIEKARNIFSGKIYLAGGINLENIELLTHLPYDGIALVSGIMNAENPTETLKKFQLKINQ